MHIGGHQTPLQAEHEYITRVWKSTLVVEDISFHDNGLGLGSSLWWYFCVISVVKHCFVKWVVAKSLFLLLVLVLFGYFLLISPILVKLTSCFVPLYVAVFDLFFTLFLSLCVTECLFVCVVFMCMNELFPQRLMGIFCFVLSQVCMIIWECVCESVITKQKFFILWHCRKLLQCIAFHIYSTLKKIEYLWDLKEKFRLKKNVQYREIFNLFESMAILNDVFLFATNKYMDSII